ncbi:MAG TPA: serine/threonine-protein kinase [Vicinamibacterales bacterium]|nr:serine/threonine-protein kinase [Vicinamibacterales bacterium]
MQHSTQGPTLFVPEHRGASILERATTGFPPDLLNRVAIRFQILLWLYAFTFFMAAFFPSLLSADQRARLFEHPMTWVPGAVSITMAVLVAVTIRVARLPPAGVTVLALVFEVVSSYGIAAAEFLQPRTLNIDSSWIGHSWVSVWMLLFNVVVPTVPRYAVVAALASVTSVPVMVRLSLSLFPLASPPNHSMIFWAFGFPYLLVVIMAYVGARVVYSLGTEVTRARELGSYRLEHRLGQGGMGEVWKASHRLLARPAAIKLIRSSVAGNAPGITDDMRRRFEREAQVIAQLRSPHTVTLFDFGIAAEGSFYYVMELLDGLDTDALVKRFGAIPAERVVHILRQICHSLSEAESRSLVHRDIKPANVFLCRYGEDYDFVKVLDFGLAKAVHETTSDTETAITIENVIQGTPAFIAPEQALGGADVDGRADIYATGCVAYWLLTGQLVFTAETTMKTLLAHAQQTPERPSARSTLAIPPDLDALVLSCLAKDREHRPSSARDLLARLDAIRLDHPWTSQRAREWWTANMPP